ncbi:mannose-1-phosphate guanyltransferase [Robertkochia marina]|uniref:Mannose-1-phosphate guanyltransferase n=1 Tax=Robertkochia marina TaxID=1227945 RepID=A0A4S3LZY8_9FLAO|nr:sugar phosphate nucleotidyltransferase [Robertkochia marina]THD67720.1 mannose-1-phosphate guanyltransferase [Robertkochia marina]TRZ43451.1 mannose-1-phosphate guanyltransferase [Robertkochia marina]
MSSKPDQNSPRIINAILSGGFGTRLWPLSTPEKPKQFLQLFNRKSLFQHTVLRNSNLVDATMIITNEGHITQAEGQMGELGKEFGHVILEPVARNTAPAIALAALAVDENDILFVTPSDHMIGMFEYERGVERSLQLAKEGYLVTFGIKPKYPETGFGYIEFEGEKVKSFREKPDVVTAQEFLKKGNFYWNSGMFCFKAGVFLEELKKLSPEIYQKSEEAHEAGITKETMAAIPEDSVDYAVFERSDKIRTVAADFEWTDLGNYDALVDYFKNHDEIGPVKEVEGVGNSNTHVLTKKRVLGIGLEDLNVIETNDTILVLQKGNAQKVKELYKQFK